MNQYSEIVRVADYLIEKYGKQAMNASGRRDVLKPGGREDQRMQRNLTRAEAEHILRIYRTSSVTITDLALRFNRSVPMVSKLVNGKHKFSRP